MMVNSPSPEMDSKSAVTLLILLPVGVIGALFSRLTTARVVSSTPASGQVHGSLPTSVEVVLVILMGRISVFPT